MVEWRMIHIRVADKAFLLDYLFQQLKDFKKTKVRELLKYGSVQVNGSVTTKHLHPHCCASTATHLRPLPQASNLVIRDCFGRI